jgi:hypothetical protein
VTGSVGVAGWIAHIAFWAILGLGVAFGELQRRGAALSLLLWIAGVVVLPRLSSGSLVTSYIAVLDVLLVFVVFKGDVHLS